MHFKSIKVDINLLRYDFYTENFVLKFKSFECKNRKERLLI